MGRLAMGGERRGCRAASAVVCACLTMKMMAGAFSRAMRNTSLTILGPSPRYFCTNSLPTTRMNDAVVWCATALAIIVFPAHRTMQTSTEEMSRSAPSQRRSWTQISCRRQGQLIACAVPVPGGPHSRTPRGGSMPICRYSSKCVSGSSTASLYLLLLNVQPAYVRVGHVRLLLHLHHTDGAVGLRGEHVHDGVGVAVEGDGLELGFSASRLMVDRMRT